MNPVTNESPSSEVYAFEGYSIFKRKDGIIQIQFKPGFVIGIEDARYYMSIVGKIKNEGKCLLLIIFESDNSFTRETREQMSCAETAEIIKATGIVMQGMALKILIDGYININKPKHHVKMFENSKKAANWLLELD